MSDPVRLLGSRRDGVTRALLESAASPGPTNTQCDELWSSLAMKLPDAVVAGAAGGAAGGILAKLATSATSKGIAVGSFVKGAVVVGVVTASLAAVGLTRPWESQPEAAANGIACASSASSSSFPSPPAPAASLPPALVTDERPIAPPEPTPSKRLPSASTARARPPTRAEAPPPAESESALPTESASLLWGRQLLRSGDCDAAVAQLKGTAARFPNGELAQERAVLSIEALACSGRATEASTLAQAFVRDYPTSPHAGKVRRFTR